MNRQLRILVLSALVSSPCLANDWLISAGAGQSTYKDTCGDSYFPSCDDQDMAYRVGIGYQIEPNYHVELSFIDFGEAEATSASQEQLTANTKTVALQMTAATPLSSSIDLYGKFGAAWNKSTLEYDFQTPTTAKQQSIEDSTTGLIATIGLSSTLRPNLRIHGQIDALPKGFRVHDTTPNDVFEAASNDLYLWSLGVDFSF